MKFLPRIYEIPIFHKPSDAREFDDNSLLLLKPDDSGNLTIETEEGEFTYEGFEGFLKLFKSKYNWTFSRLNELPCIFKFLNRRQLEFLSRVGQIKVGLWTIFWNEGFGKIRIMRGGDTHTSQYLVDIGPFLCKDYSVATLDQLRYALDKLLLFNRLVPVNMVSPASTSKDLTLDWVGPGEFYLFNKLRLKDTKFLHDGYVGPRMETRGIGTLESVGNLDMIKAHLRILGTVPSLNSDNIKKVVRTTSFHEDAHPGSVYLCKVKVPEYFNTFPPIPSTKRSYPVGEFRAVLPKPYLELARKLHLDFTILESLQIIIRDHNLCPFKGLSDYVEGVEDTFQEYLYPINLKLLHYPLIGHMMSIHKEVDPDSLEISYKASQDYSPAMANAVTSIEAIDIWNLAISTDSEAIRVDAVTGRNMPQKEGFKLTSPGNMTFFNPYLKDKPGESLYRDLIYRDRDQWNMDLRFPYRRGIRDADYNPKKLGTVVNYVMRLAPGAGTREMEKPKRLGELLEGRLPTYIPSGNNQEDTSQDGVTTAWVDKYLHLYPQTLK